MNRTEVKERKWSHLVLKPLRPHKKVKLSCGCKELLSESDVPLYLQTHTHALLKQ